MSKKTKMILSTIIVSIIIGGIIITPHIVALICLGVSCVGVVAGVVAIAWRLVFLILEELFN
jgi:hypothetical protein